MSGSIVITHPHSLATPGGGTVGCLQIARQLNELGAEVHLVPVATASDRQPEGVAGRVIPVQPSRVHYLLDGLSLAKAVRDLVAVRNVDAVLGWSSEAAFLPRMLQSKRVVFGMFAALPSYAMWFNRKTSLRPVKKMADLWFRCRPLKQSDVVFALSNFTREELISLVGVAPERIRVAYWGVDPMIARIPRSPAGEISRLIFCGSLAPLKGVFDVIRALGLVTAKGCRRWQLKIAGWSDEEQVCRAGREQGIGERMVLLGRLEQVALLREFEWAQLAILPSHAESFGLAIAEAQASGLPVVAYHTGSVPEVVYDRVTGYLVPAGRVDLLAEAIACAMSDPLKCFHMGLAGRERVTRVFSWNQTAQKIVQGIEETKERLLRCEPSWKRH